MLAMKSLLKKLIPRELLSLYHLTIAYLGAMRYGFPGKKMVVIGVTGTRGKTTTANFIWSVLTAAGYSVGLTGTANIRIGREERMNPYHMTMPGRFAMQKMLADMKRAGCEIAVVETPSEGIEQYRERGIAYDILVLTSLYPEYLEVHRWDFERLKQQIEKLFAGFHRLPRKKLRGHAIPKAIIVNAGIEERERFLKHPADKKLTFSAHDTADITAARITPTATSVQFEADGTPYELRLVGSFNVANALGAIAVGRLLGIEPATIQQGLRDLPMVPGRMEVVGPDNPFTVFVDYAHDGPSIEAALTAAREIAHTRGGKVTILLGGEGGGRDKKKRPVMGELAARLADTVIVSNVDPYDDDPMEIIEDIARASEAAGKKRGDGLFAIEDRRAGIKKALALAAPGDVVLITGKGAEQSMILGSKTIPWDDRTIVQEELRTV